MRSFPCRNPRLRPRRWRLRATLLSASLNALATCVVHWSRMRAAGRVRGGVATNAEALESHRSARKLPSRSIVRQSMDNSECECQWTEMRSTRVESQPQPKTQRELVYRHTSFPDSRITMHVNLLRRLHNRERRASPDTSRARTRADAWSDAASFADRKLQRERRGTQQRGRRPRRPAYLAATVGATTIASGISETQAARKRAARSRPGAPQ